MAGQGVYAGLEYFDGQFDDARLAICLAKTAAEQNATIINHMAVSGLVKDAGRVTGVEAIDRLSGKGLRISGRVVINATGIFIDNVNAMAGKAEPILAFSQGSHVVLDRRLLPGESALVIPSTKNGRVLFAIPWHGMVLAGTTDIPVQKPESSPTPTADEVNFLLTHLEEYLVEKPTNGDVKSIFAGIRPLLANSRQARTSSLSRNHAVFTSEESLVSVAGGKWTTYRQMAEDAVHQVAAIAGLEQRRCVTKGLPLSGSDTSADGTEADDFGFNASKLGLLEAESTDLKKQIHPNLPYKKSNIVHAVRNEMALTLEDALSRRTRSLLLNTQASLECAPAIAAIMASELDRDQSWIQALIKTYSLVARNYLMPQ